MIKGGVTKSRQKDRRASLCSCQSKLANKEKRLNVFIHNNQTFASFWCIIGGEEGKRRNSSFEINDIHNQKETFTDTNGGGTRDRKKVEELCDEKGEKTIKSSKVKGRVSLYSAGLTFGMCVHFQLLNVPSSPIIHPSLIAEHFRLFCFFFQSSRFHFRLNHRWRRKRMIITHTPWQQQLDDHHHACHIYSSLSVLYGCLDANGKLQLSGMDGYTFPLTIFG